MAQQNKESNSNTSSNTATTTSTDSSQTSSQQQSKKNDDSKVTTTDAAPAKKNRGGKGRRKIEIKYIEDKTRRQITFSKRKAGLMKKAYELSTLTGTQILVLVTSETGHVYTFATKKFQPFITDPKGKNLIQQCLSASEIEGNEQPEQEEDDTEEDDNSQNYSRNSATPSDEIKTEPRAALPHMHNPQMQHSNDPNLAHGNFQSPDYGQRFNGMPPMMHNPHMQHPPFIPPQQFHHSPPQQGDQGNHRNADNSRSPGMLPNSQPQQNFGGHNPAMFNAPQSLSHMHSAPSHQMPQFFNPQMHNSHMQRPNMSRGDHDSQRADSNGQRGQPGYFPGNNHNQNEDSSHQNY